MVKEVKYGVISDIHEDPRIIVPTLQVLRQLGAEKLLVNGDIGGRMGSLEQSQQFTAFILNELAKTGLETFVQPGSHETILGYHPVVEHFAGKFSNIVDALKVPKVEQTGHTLVFLPGSDFTCGGEYSIGNGKIPTGFYQRNGNDLIKSSFEEYVALLQQGINLPAMRHSNMSDLSNLVTNPERTIVVCHVPQKFNNIDTGVDVAEFWQQRVYHRDPKNMDNFTFTELGVVPSVVSREEIEHRYGTKAYNSSDMTEDELTEAAVKLIKKEDVERWPIYVRTKANRGNQALAELYDKLGIRKSVTGHFHESSHRATDRNGNKVNAGKYTKELFWNSGHLDQGYTGILSVRGEEVKYDNVDLRDYLK